MGTAKSTATRMLAALVDPSRLEAQPLPKDLRDLAVTANNLYVLTFDNISTITAEQSDALCRMATGSGFGTRTLYSNDGLTVFHAKRPVILNGIPDFVSRPDLADRALRVELERIDAGNRRAEGQLMRDFETAAPLILGALLTAVALGLANLPNTPETDATTRLADFEQWAQACELALWHHGTFAQALRDNRQASITATIEGDPTAALALKLAELPDGWRGTATEFLAEAQGRLPSDDFGRLPKTAKLIGNRLRLLAPALRAIGVIIETRRAGPNGDRLFYLTATPQKLETASVRSDSPG